MSDPAEDPLRQAAREQERADALDAVLVQAPDIGIEAALEQFGQALSQVERDLVRSLTREELETLRKVEGKLGSRRKGRVNNNNQI